MPAKVRINDTGWRKLVRRLSAEGRKPRVKVGVLAGAGMHPSGGISVAGLAAVHEFGSPRRGIPERSFLRFPFESTTGKKELRAMTRKLAKKVIEDGLPMRAALEILGQWGVARVKRRITHGRLAKLKPATIERKGSSRPLVDTGRLLASISHEVS